MNTPQADLLQSQNLSEDTQSKPLSSDEVGHREQVEGTPFYIVGKNDEYLLTYCGYKVGDIKKTPEEAEEQVHVTPFNIIKDMIVVTHEIIYNKILEEQKQGQ